MRQVFAGQESAKICRLGVSEDLLDRYIAISKSDEYRQGCAPRRSVQGQVLALRFSPNRSDKFSQATICPVARLGEICSNPACRCAHNESCIAHSVECLVPSEADFAVLNSSFSVCQSAQRLSWFCEVHVEASQMVRSCAMVNALIRIVFVVSNGIGRVDACVYGTHVRGMLPIALVKKLGSMKELGCLREHLR
jgi:hypothetical protein